MILLVLVIIGLAAVAGIYFSRYTVLQREYDSQLAQEVEEARAEQKQQDEAEFTERQKEPFRSYTAPPILGDIVISFPKNWSLHVIEAEASSTALDLTMHPEAIKENRNVQAPYALRVTLERELYSEVLGSYSSAVTGETLNAQAIEISGITGTRLNGEIRNGVEGALVLLPLRDKTLSIWTESDRFISDFNKIIEALEVSP